MTNHQLSLTSSNTYRFQDENLDLELCYHPFSGRETVAFDGVIVSEEHNPTPGFSYNFEFNGNDYTLIQDRPADRSYNYHYQLNKNGHPIQRYEIKPEHKRKASIYLLPLSAVIIFPAIAGEISRHFVGVSPMDWNTITTFSVTVGALFTAIAIHVSMLGRLIIKKTIWTSPKE
ncbi:hypothetical protein D8Y20_07905 [Mariprofundus sp. EBB-1]|uniref:hypothetical protein n=1 Tax=Mariprofundus sp. EBB-1 TaxID=2650971 RepID=UPI000EF249E5|nr:hypothetical protein [Mariprofundus sp. EBB-1]RLL51925.1 hypothetical protein D8Y20_07905 [Mariprofundus sp. EBB-1]